MLLTDDQHHRTLIASYLKRKSYDVETFNSISEFAASKEHTASVILSKCTWDELRGGDLVKHLRLITSSPIILYTTDVENLKQAISSIKAGAADYLLWPLRPEELLTAVEKTIEDPASSKQPLPIQQKNLSKRFRETDLEKSGEMFIGKNPQFQRAIQQVKLVAKTNYSVILYGESGTGKEMIAKLIHEQSDRYQKPFVAIDCGALTEELANSELFGHEKGAFTGAIQHKRGCLEEAHGGTIFLDEIANLSYSIQVALLRVIQERKIKRIGSSEDTPIDVRIIVASNENLSKKFEAGLFREDLYYRLNEFFIEIPPLRNRKEDLPALVYHFIKEANAELGKKIIGCSTGVINVLGNYDFPGNLRELKNVIKRACLVARDTITIADLPGNLLTDQHLHQAVHHLPQQAEQLQEHPEPLKLEAKSQATLKDVLQLREFELIIKTLKEHKYNKSKVARLLQIDRKTLYNKLAMFKDKKLDMC